MSSPIEKKEYEAHMAAVVADGFTLDPPGYERLSMWTHMLMNLVAARANLERVRDHPIELGNMGSFLSQQAFLIAGIMAYSRCYTSSGLGIPMLDAKQVYAGSADGQAVHERLIRLRNTVAAHTDTSDIIRLTLAVKVEPKRIIVRHLCTTAIPVNEIADFLEAIAHTEHFATVSLNKCLDHLQRQTGKLIELD